MMRRPLYILLAIFLLGVSCRKEQPHESDNRISFHVYTPMDLATRAEVTDETILETSETSVYVYESRQTLFGTSGIALLPENNGSDYSGRWLPQGDWYWGDTWNVDYQFWGWAYSPAGSSDISISDAGTTIEVTQPSTYPSGGGYVDYLLSYIHSEPALASSTDNRKSIPLAFEHALTMVDIYLYREQSMTDNPSLNMSVDVVIDELTLGKIYNKAKMSCNSHAYLSTNQQRNAWSVQSKSGSVDYSLTNIPDDDIKEREEALALAPMMRFISIPVTNTDMLPNDRYKLTVKYTVTVSDTITDESLSNTYIEAFDLSAVTLAWLSGHRVKYELCISNGIELTGTIVDWVDVEYVEGVVLPNIE
ncbi:MAG: hypothetical protein ACI3ZL_01435 [Candidatus Cryptobacteroides sp.]